MLSWGVRVAVRPVISAAIGNSKSSTAKVSGVAATTVPAVSRTCSAPLSTTSEPCSISMIDAVSVAWAVKDTGRSGACACAAPVAAVNAASESTAGTTNFLINMRLPHHFRSSERSTVAS